MGFELKIFGDSAVLLTFGDEINLEVHQKIVGFVNALKKKNISGVSGIISAYTTVTIQYDFFQISYEELVCEITQLDDKQEVLIEQKLVEIPVCYDMVFGLDMEYLCSYVGLSKEEVIKIHTSKVYLVYMLGFTPGFFYLGGMDTRLYCPRKENPRLKIESGSVGIAGDQTGVYSVDSPGGWQLIGKTPVKIFNKNRMDTLFKVKQGDLVRFVEISFEEYNSFQK
jgi:KipI family sensor histidine kinase inhibitor